MWHSNTNFYPRFLRSFGLLFFFFFCVMSLPFFQMIIFFNACKIPRLSSSLDFILLLCARFSLCVLRLHFYNKLLVKLLLLHTMECHSISVPYEYHFEISNAIQCDKYAFNKILNRVSNCIYNMNKNMNGKTMKLLWDEKWAKFLYFLRLK